MIVHQSKVGDAESLRKMIDNAGLASKSVLLADDSESGVKESYNVAGVSALNRGLIAAASLPFVTHIARLDDDDTWNPSHLSALAEVYLRRRTADFVFSRAERSDYSDENRVIPSGFSSEADVRTAPIACQISHSAVSWKLGRFTIRYRTESEQIADPQEIQCCPELPCPADADLWTTLRKRVLEKKFESWLVANITSSITGWTEKARLRKMVQQLCPTK